MKALFIFNIEDSGEFFSGITPITDLMCFQVWVFPFKVISRQGKIT